MTFSERVEQLKKEMGGDEPPADKSDIGTENAYLKRRVAELEQLQDNEEHWKEQVMLNDTTFKTFNKSFELINASYVPFNIMISLK